MNDKMKWSFKRELLLCFSILALAPLIISNSFLMQVFQSAIARDNEKKAQQQLQNMQEVICEELQHFEEACEKISKNQQVRTGIDDTDRWVSNRIYTDLYRHTNGLRDFALFRIYNAQGECRYSTGTDTEEATLPVYWGSLRVAKAHPDKLLLQNTTQNYSTDNMPVLRAVRAICNEADECVGYVVVDMKEENLDKLFLNSYDAQNGVVMLDRFGEEIYSSRVAKAEKLAQTVRARYFAGEGIRQETDEIRCFIESVGDTGLYLVIGIPTVFTREVITQLLTIILIMTLLSVFLCLAVAEIMSSNLSRPVRRLSDAMHMVENGDFSVQIASARNDELGQLTNNFNRMTAELKEYMELQVKQQKELDNANIAMMQAQLNPHFLYNTLDTMKWIAKANHITELATLASGLATILRTGISEEQFVTLAAELKLVECYIDIQKIRFQDKFSFDMEVPMELEDCMVPKLIVQPIVENAVVHGLSESKEGHIFLNIYPKNQDMYIEVSDDGCGMSEELINKINNREKEGRKGHLGIRNVDTILRLYYGQAYGLSIQNIATGGTKVIMTLPITMNKIEEERDGK